MLWQIKFSLSLSLVNRTIEIPLNRMSASPIYTDEWSHGSRFFGKRRDFGRRLSGNLRVTSREDTVVY